MSERHDPVEVAVNSLLNSIDEIAGLAIDPDTRERLALEERWIVNAQDSLLRIVNYLYRQKNRAA